MIYYLVRDDDGTQLLISEEHQPEARVLPKKQFVGLLMGFFRYKLIGRTPCDKIIEEAKTRFGEHLRRKSFKKLFSDACFSLFEVAPWGARRVVSDAVQHFIRHKLERHSGIDLELSSQLPPEFSASDTVPYFVNPLSGKSYSVDFFYSPSLLLDLETARRLVRYGVRSGFCPLQMYGSLMPLLKLLRTDLLPPIFGDFDVNLGTIHHVCETYHKRLYVVLLVLYATLQTLLPDSFPRCHDSVRSLRLVFQTIPEPFVAVHEITSFLHFVFQGVDKESAIAEFCEIVLQCFPKSAEPLGPRSLKHLSRCEVRRCMGRAGTLPKGVRSLHVPRGLRDYLLAQRSEEEHLPKYVSVLRSGKRSASSDRSAKRRKLGE